MRASRFFETTQAHPPPDAFAMRWQNRQGFATIRSAPGSCGPPSQPSARNRLPGGTAVSWDFETEPEFQKQLDWIEKFVHEEVEPLDYVLGSPYDVRDNNRNKLVRPLQAQVRKHKLWACHLEPELGGQGYGQVKLALMNEILGPSRFAPTVFGCQAPDTGNSEILAKYVTADQKKNYIEPLLNNEIGRASCRERA